MRQLVLGYEIFVREFDAKLLLAAVAAARGWQVTFGPFGEVVSRRSFIAPGVFWITDAAAPRSRLLARLAKAGHRLVCGDEEGVVHYNDQTYVAERLDPSAIVKMDRCFFWGNAYAQIAIEKFPGSVGTFVASGNPRVDLLRPEFFSRRVASPKRNARPTILVVSNFGGANPFHKDTSRFEASFLEAVRSRGELEGFYSACFEHQRRLFERFLGLVGRLALEFPDAAIVVRPHPSESDDAWLRLTQDHSNVVVARDGNIIEALSGCDVMIHNGCTTAIEALLIGRPALAYCPFSKSEYELDLPNAVSERFETFESLACAARRVLSGKLSASQIEGFEGRCERLSQYISSLTGRLACERITDELDALAVKSVSRLLPFILRCLYIPKRVAVGLTNAGARLRGRILNQSGYVKPISKAGVEAKLAALKECMPGLAAVRLRSIGNGCFELYTTKG